MKIFRDRVDAGKQLAERLSHYREKENVVVLGLPRGGVTVAAEIALFLACTLDILIVRKLGFPTNPELAIGAISETGTVVLNHSIISAYDLPEQYIEEETDHQVKEIDRRRLLYRASKGLTRLDGKTVILVDDGIATGATFKTAIKALKAEPIARIVAAVPVAPFDTAREVEGMVDEWVCLQNPETFFSVGGFYELFEQVSDDEVVDILRSSLGPVTKVKDAEHTT